MCVSIPLHVYLWCLCLCICEGVCGVRLCLHTDVYSQCVCFSVCVSLHLCVQTYGVHVCVSLRVDVVCLFVCVGAVCVFTRCGGCSRVDRDPGLLSRALASVPEARVLGHPRGPGLVCRGRGDGTSLGGCWEACTVTTPGRGACQPRLRRVSICGYQQPQGTQDATITGTRELESPGGRGVCFL